MATIMGAAVSFGFAGTTNGLTETTTTVLTGKFLLQSIQTAYGADKEEVRDNTGEIVAVSFSNAHSTAALEYVVADTVVAYSLATARTDSAVPDIGSLINITACLDMPDLVETNWVVVGEPKVGGSNGSAKRVTLNLESHAGVTAAAT